MRRTFNTHDKQRFFLLLLKFLLGQKLFQPKEILAFSNLYRVNSGLSFRLIKARKSFIVKFFNRGEISEFPAFHQADG
jgi:hypothetical protein